jgi:hypothetical protein
MDVPLDPLTVIGMDPTDPPLACGPHVIRDVAVGCVECLVPKQVIGDQIPVPDQVVGSPCNKAVALNCLLKSIACLPALGDVANSSDEAECTPVFPNCPTTGRDPARAAIKRIDGSELDVKNARTRKVNGILNCPVRSLTVLRMKPR